MMARISRSATSKETSWSALTPPKESETFSTERIAFMRPCASCRVFRRRGDEGPGLFDAQLRRERAGAAVLVLHLRLDVHAAASAVERRDQRGVLLADEAAPHLPRARQLAVVGVE